MASSIHSQPQPSSHQRRLDKPPITQTVADQQSLFPTSHLAQIAEGRSNAGIAAALFIAERTVETHTTQIFQKLGLETSGVTHRRVLAVLAYLQSASE